MKLAPSERRGNVVPEVMEVTWQVGAAFGRLGASGPHEVYVKQSIPFYLVTDANGNPLNSGKAIVVHGLFTAKAIGTDPFVIIDTNKLQ
jgi:hypothetical protein